MCSNKTADFLAYLNQKKWCTERNEVTVTLLSRVGNYALFIYTIYRFVYMWGVKWSHQYFWVMFDSINFWPEVLSLSTWENLIRRRSFSRASNNTYLPWFKPIQWSMCIWMQIHALFMVMQTKMKTVLNDCLCTTM